MANELIEPDQGKRKVVRHNSAGLRKVCGCPRRQWSRCNHPWHFNFKWRGDRYRFSLERRVERLVQVSKNGKSVWTRDRMTLGELIGGKEDAKVEADRLRTAIRNREIQQMTPVSEPITADANTLKQVAELFLERFTPPKARDRAAWARDARARMGNITGYAFPNEQILGEKQIGAVTEDDLEVFIVALRAKRSASTKNHHVQLLNQLFRWAVKKGYLERNPISDDSGIKREKPASRERRLADDEEPRLLAAAHPRLQRLIIAGMETGCRAGELLALQMKDVHMERREIVIRAENTKDNETRILPMSSRLHAVLEMARLDPSGHELKPDGYVFGDGTGRRLTTFKRAWNTTKLRAHGYKPTWEKNGKLSKASRAALQVIDLHFHDLRHEAGSRMHEGGMPLHHVQQFLGHADLSTTSRYLNAPLTHLKTSMQKLDETRNGGKPVANETEESNGLVCHDDATKAAKPLVN
jgi:integrase